MKIKSIYRNQWQKRSIIQTNSISQSSKQHQVSKHYIQHYIQQHQNRQTTMTNQLGFLKYTSMHFPERPSTKPRHTAHTPCLFSIDLHTVRQHLVIVHFSSASSSVWNSIPNDVRCAPSLSSFKSRLKTFLFSSVYKKKHKKSS